LRSASFVRPFARSRFLFFSFSPRPVLLLSPSSSPLLPPGALFIVIIPRYAGFGDSRFVRLVLRLTTAKGSSTREFPVCRILFASALFLTSLHLARSDKSGKSARPMTAR
jgi:hypothetical protein